MLEESKRTCSSCESPSDEGKTGKTWYKHLMALSSGILLLIGILSELIAPSTFMNYPFYISSVVCSGQFIIPKGIKGVASRRLDQHFLMSSASIAAIIIGAPAEGAAVMFLFFISILLEERAEDRVRQEIETLVELEPPSVIVKLDNREVCMNPTDVKLGDLIIVRPGVRIGIDGIIVDGATSVDQSTITGESHPIPKSVGDEVFAGTINQEGYIEVEVTALSSESILSKIIELVDESRKKRAPIEKTISRFSRVYTPIVLALSFAIGIISLLLNYTLTEATYRALTILVVSCPCAFAISIPVSMVSAIAGSARNGVLVKGGVYLEKISKTKIVAFDKTGTLTEGVLSVKDVCLHNEHSKDEVLSVAASLEMMSEHPIGRALVEAASHETMSVPRASSFEAIPGRGIRGQIDTKEYLIGNRRLLLDQKVSLDSLTEHSCGVGTLVYVAHQEEHFGTIILTDTLRRNAKRAIARLREMNIKTVMLTGDSENVAREIADEIGIDSYVAELLPHQKVEAINELKTEGITVFVGDGINDTPALMEADVGIAMGSNASDAALESSDIALIDMDLARVPELIKKSRKTMGIVHQNVASSLIIKSVIGFFAGIGFLSLWMAIAFGDMGLTFAVIANALRLVQKD
ncbi:cadmium-translocating P-type ATPase [Candidatus Thorarchaeota archaeon]|nr:MAG: cadmium-translocating P-type ATPase [Candidatus Thorarchaeota archaeon]